MSSDDLGSYSMEELFRAEAEAQCLVLSEGLLALEKSSDPAELLEVLMRAAHSLKGAARIVGLDQAVRVSHEMEECFVAAQRSNTAPLPAMIDVLLRGADLLRQLAGVTPGAPGKEDIDDFVRDCRNPQPFVGMREPVPSAEPSPEPSAALKRDVRLDAERLDTLLGLAGQAAVASRTGNREILAARGLLRKLQGVFAEIGGSHNPARRSALVSEAQALLSRGQADLMEDFERKDLQSRRLSRLCNRIYNETLACRLRPFGDIIPGLRRLARDVARSLGREVEIAVSGEDTEVDRDLLDRLDGPLSHVIRNAIDHGIESPDDRASLGKPRAGVIRISAGHQGGWLVITVTDDGRGLDFEAIGKAVVKRGLTSEDHVATMPESELLDFLLLPGFSLKSEVTEVSGRGVGLDAVRAMAYGSGGSLRLRRGPAGGMQCEMILPVSLSLVRTLVIEAAGDCFALPLTRVDRVLRVLPNDIHAAAGRQHIFLGPERIEILSIARALELDGGEEQTADGVPVVIIQGPNGRIGLVVDRLVGQYELSLQRIDARIGQMQDVSAFALLENGDPVVVLDVNDLAITAANFSSGSRYRPLSRETAAAGGAVRRILVADDSLTVRELERKLLAGRGYVVETAVDGADAWNALRNGSFDLLVTDIDMPRLDGLQLTRMIRGDAKFRDLPVVVVSYKDREEDRAKGLEAGADFYLPKSSYQDQSLVNAVQELIGDPVTAS